MIKPQQGVGLLEVMVALMLLAVAVLGYSAMQLRATNVSLEANNNTHALEIARDLHERMRINREGITRFESGGFDKSTTPVLKNCRTTDCDADDLIIFDFHEVSNNAENLGMSLAVRECPIRAVGNNRRHCIYVAWGDTTPTTGTASTACTDDDNTYQPNAQCVFMESFSYAN